ncbi:FlgO family outer membrane protein [Rheinheimera gaetbuli]
MLRKIFPLMCVLSVTSCQNTLPAAPVLADSVAGARYSEGFSPSRYNVQLDSYVEQMIIKMLPDTPAELTKNIAVASFVDFDSSLQQTHALGNQLAENFLTLLPRFGYAVTDTKVTKHIASSDRGDLIFSRQQRLFFRNKNVHAVLAGTLIYTPKGVEVYSRLIRLKDQSVISSAKITIPYFVVRHLGEVK